MIKNTLDIEDLDSGTDDFKPITPSRKEIKREWDHLFKDNNLKNDVSCESIKALLFNQKIYDSHPNIF